ncbi:hypothetical protein MUY35_02020 [Aliiroseovarius sp. S1339]|uniref:hypothetical protein n=1 Tax=Aliiroseovarius sp. S1339 TaxID=2936990 RepID=UPI0020BF93D6|nr:hypothetical protein [Aliiroseovarius sp. S1339]MCK8462626.1 hypothetical protein [Aliiroseovarius sp. S1339]
MKKFCAAACIAALSVIAVPAAAKTYECKLKMSRSGGNWMGPTMYVDYDEKNGAATVIDGVLNNFFGKPQTVSRITDNEKRVTFAYTVSLPGGTTRSALPVTSKHVYRLTVLKRSLKAKVFMKPVGFDNTFRDSGTCVVK